MDKEERIEEERIEKIRNTYHAYIKIFMYIFAILYKSGKFRHINPGATKYENPEVLLTVYLLHIIGKSGKILKKLEDTDIGRIRGLITEEKMLDEYIKNVKSQENSTQGKIQKIIRDESKRIHVALPAAIRLFYDGEDVNGLHADELHGLKQALKGISKQGVIEAFKEVVNAKLKFQYSASTVIINNGIINFVNTSIKLGDMRQGFYNSKLELHEFKGNKDIVQKIKRSISFFDNDKYKTHCKGDVFLFVLLNIGNMQRDSLKKTFDFFFESDIYNDFFYANLPWGAG